MGEARPPLSQCTLLLPTSVSHGLDEALSAIRSSRQTRRLQQRIGYEAQGSVFPNAYGTLYAIVTQRRLPS
jgi:hypothetical protein